MEKRLFMKGNEALAYGAIKAGCRTGDIRALWIPAVTQFESRRKEHLLYPRGS